jgi:TetR/AcrR family transcriptional regulator, transcriptional repressor for nem operon
MAGPQRRVGRESSETRHALLDAVEKLMAKEGYAAVSYRAVAGQVGVSAALVQYYFPALDDIFLAALRRRAGENLERLRDALDTSDDPLRTVWEFSTSEGSAALTAEFLALGNHRKAVAAEIAAITNQVRALQLDALRRRTYRLDLQPEALVFLLSGVPKLLQLEERVGVDFGHDELVAAIERTLS